MRIDGYSFYDSALDEKPDKRFTWHMKASSLVDVQKLGHIRLNDFKAHKYDALSRHDSAKPRRHAPIQHQNSLFAHRLPETVQRAIVHVCIDALHARFEEIKGVIPHC